MQRRKKNYWSTSKLLSQYWSSSLSDGYSDGAYYLGFYSGGSVDWFDGDRYRGRSVRAVCQ